MSITWFGKKKRGRNPYFPNEDKRKGTSPGDRNGGDKEEKQPNRDRAKEIPLTL